MGDNLILEGDDSFSSILGSIFKCIVDLGKFWRLIELGIVFLFLLMNVVFFFKNPIDISFFWKPLISPSSTVPAFGPSFLFLLMGWILSP